MKVALIVFVISLALAAIACASGPQGTTTRHINCCFPDGQCLRVRRHHCEFKKGIVVQDCKTCKPVWDQNKDDK